MKDKNVYKLVVVALFSALCFVGTMIQIPLPSGGMIHLGNFFCILAALLCGGVIGGLAGGIGCGLYDLIIYSSPVGMVQYAILKFIMGFLVGSLFRFIINKRKKINYTITLGVVGSLIVLFTVLVIAGYISGNFALSSSIKNQELYIGIVCTIGFLFSIVLFVFCGLSSRLKKMSKCILFVCSISVLVNILLEFVAKIIINYGIEGLTFEASLIKGFSSLPSCILTGCVTVAFISIIFPRLYAATKNLNSLNNLDEEALFSEE